MKKSTLVLMLTLFVFGLLGLASLAVAQQGSSESKAASQTKEAKEATEQAPAAKTMPMVHRAKAEQLSGTISMVDTEKKLVIVTDSNGTPFNFKVTGGTRIKVAGKKAKLDDLSSQTNKQATISFVEMRRGGDVARSIEVSE